MRLGEGFDPTVKLCPKQNGGKENFAVVQN